MPSSLSNMGAANAGLASTRIVTSRASRAGGFWLRMPACKVLSVMYTHNEASSVRIEARENGASVIGSVVVVNVHTGAGLRADAGAAGAGRVDGRAPPPDDSSGNPFERSTS